MTRDEYIEDFLIVTKETAVVSGLDNYNIL